MATKQSILSLALLLAASTALAQIQTKDQQKCINKINKDAIKIQAAQGKLNSGCIKDTVKGKLTGPTAGEDCIDGDAKMKVSKKQQKLLSDESKKCTPLLPNGPDFAYTSGAGAAATAADAELALVHTLYGDPLDSGLYLCDTNPAECFCQRTTSKRINKIFRAASKIFVKCKKAALTVGKDPFPLGADGPEDIEDCVTNGLNGLSVEADTKGKVGTAISQLGDTIGQFCGQTPNDEFGSGACSGLSGTPLRDCIGNQVKCHFCEMINGVDGLSIDCATWSSATCSVP